MSKLEVKVINYVKLLTIDMLKGSSKEEYLSNYNSVPLFYCLYMNHFVFDNKNDFTNRDRLLISPSFREAYYATSHFIKKNISLESIKEYTKYQALINDNEVVDNNILGIGSGLAYGEKYLESLVKKENKKSSLISFHTYLVCKYSELLEGNNLEVLNHVNKYNLNKLHIIVFKDINDKNDYLEEYTELLGFNVIECKNNISGINSALNDAKESKECNIIFITPINEKLEFDSECINNLYTKYKIDNIYEVDSSIYKEIKDTLEKRISKVLNKWNEELSSNITNDNIIKINEFLNNKELNININVDNIKINDTYEEEINKGNNKILNVYASKSPFVFSISKDFNNSLTNIKDSERNILFNGNYSVMNSFGIGLSYLGFKVFISMPLIYSNSIYNDIKFLIENTIPITYILTNDSIINPYNNKEAIYELNNLRMIPGLINFRPSDINEIIGSYAIISKIKKPSTIIISDDKAKILTGTNPKYVVAGAYRIKRERGEATGVLISSGSEVKIALKLSEELLPYGIDLRVVTMPSMELFESQGERYKYTLLPHDLKTFVLEYSSTKLWEKYTKDERYVLGLNKYSINGTKEEILNYYNLDMDSLKTRIIELMKENC